METHVRDLAVRQTKAASVSIVVANSNRRTEETLVSGINVTRVGCVGTIASMPVCPGLTRAIRRSPADLVHIHMPNPGAAHAFLASGHSGKVVLTHHADTLGREFLRRLSDPYVNRLMRRASRIIVTSSRYLASSTELKPFQDKCTIVPLGIEIPPPFVEHHQIEKLRQTFGSKFVLSIGRLVPYKGFDVLIRAMKDLDTKLVLIGDGPERSRLLRLAQSHGVEQKVVLLGHVDDMRPYLAAASIFVLPSITRAEAFGMVQLEAMASGLPVINTDIDSGVPEICIDGETGLTVRPNDACALSVAMQSLLEDDRRRNELGAAARARVKDEYTADLMAQRVLSVYSDVLGLNNFASLHLPDRSLSKGITV